MNRLKQMETKKHNLGMQLEFYVKEWFVQILVKELFERNLLDAVHKAQQLFQYWIFVVQSMVAQHFVQVLEIFWLSVKVYVEFGWGLFHR